MGGGFRDEGITPAFDTPALEEGFVDVDDEEFAHCQEVTARAPPKKREPSYIGMSVGDT